MPDLEGTPAPELPFTIVAIGASAGGLEACSLLLGAMPRKPGIAIVIVQHLDPTHESTLAGLLGGSSDMPVVQASDAMPVDENHVYVIPPNTQMWVEQGRLRLEPRPDSRTQFMPIDFFFRSLARYSPGRAIGVVLSGTASDGALGLREIKEVGGITLAQEPTTAKYDGMPRAAIATGAVDLVLPPVEIARELLRIGRDPFVRLAKPPGIDAQGDGAEDLFRRIFLLLRNGTGIDFRHYKQPTLRRRLHRRMLLQKIDKLAGYLPFLQQNPAEVQALCRDFLIHVTRFFRDPDSFASLVNTVLPRLDEHGRDNSPIRIWVPGCATGEEAYSIAIALLEFLDSRGTSVPIQVFATDISEEAIVFARAGLYPETITSDVSPERLRRFFNRVDGSYRIAKTVRDLCVFARQDLTRDPPFSKLNLIVCRNVLIYLGPMLQQRLMSSFYYALKPQGFLMLGSAETIGSHVDLFTPVDKRHKLFSKNASAARADLDFLPAERTPARSVPAPRGGADGRRPTDVQNEVNRFLLGRYAPPGVIVNDNMQIVQFRGQTGLFLEPAPGDASLNLLKMAREGLLYGLRTALHEARKCRKPVRRERLHVKRNGKAAEVNIEVVPLRTSQDERHFLVLFEEVLPLIPPALPPAVKQTQKRSKASVASGRFPEALELGRLQQELAASREYLQSIIQDLEATNEELQSANEEILSSNEELQSTNEELDTAKEELQSTNEELNTVNDELHGRNDELSQVNSDLLNLLGSVQIAIVMIAGDLRVRRFTPMAEKVLNLISADVGRPISDIKPNIICPDLKQLITEAIETVSIKEREVQDGAGTWYMLRVRPYKNLDNRIDGAVLALFDIDSTKRLEARVASAQAEASSAALNSARAYSQAILQTISSPIAIMDGGLRVQSANASFYKLSGVTAAEAEGRKFYEMGDRRWNIPELRKILETALEREGRVDGLRLQLKGDLEGQEFQAEARRIVSTDGQPGLVSLHLEELTDK